MIVVADASVLVGELLRKRGRDLFRRPDLNAVVAEQQWGESEHEAERRVGIMVDQGRITNSQGDVLQGEIRQLVADRVIDVIEKTVYEETETQVRRRVPRDQSDWPVVALSIALDVGILCKDNDFLGCGRPTWTVETLLAELDSRRTT